MISPAEPTPSAKIFSGRVVEVIAMLRLNAPLAARGALHTESRRRTSVSLSARQAHSRLELCVRIRRCFRSDTTGFAERHKDRLHANRLVPDMARAAGHGHPQTVHPLWHQDAIW